MRALSSEESRRVEQDAVAQTGVGLGEMMEAAGTALAEEVALRAPEGAIVVLCGPGNNGGDGWVAARVLNRAGRDVRVLSTVEPGSLSGIAAEAAARAVDSGVVWAAPAGALSEADLAGADAIVDALLGTGSSLPLREPLPSWVAVANASGAYIVSADVPSGVDSDTGAVPGEAVSADCTVTFTAPKLGIVTYPGAEFAGEIVVAQVGVPVEIADVAGAVEVWPAEKYAELLPRFAGDAHKNQRGRVLVVAGSGQFPGAAVLAARGAMRSGAGYVTLAVPESVVAVAQAHLLAAPVVSLAQGRLRTLSTHAIETVLDLARDYDAVVLGPGLTQADGAVACVRALVSRLDKPLLLDADGLNALVDATELLDARTAPTILTPHPGELARLLGVSVGAIQSDRISSSQRLAGASRVVVLKGAGTVTSSDRRKVINTSGTPALATAGTGDVLAGLIGGLLAQGLGAFEAGALGAYVHGRAGEAAASDLTPVCVTAEDLPEYLPVAVAELLNSW